MHKTLILVLFIILNISLLLINRVNSTSIDVKNDNESTSSTSQPKVELKMELYSRQGIYNSRNPLMLEIYFNNQTNQIQKLCTYKFEESLLKLDIRDTKGKKIEFPPYLVKSESISDKDWVDIFPGRKYKRALSLSRKILELTGSRLAPGNYKIKAIYEGCSKFDSKLPTVNMESNRIYLMITE